VGPVAHACILTAVGEHHESPYPLVYNFQAEEEKAVDDVALLQANDLEVEAAETGRAVEHLIFDDNFLDKEFRISVDDMIFKLIAHGRSVKCDFFNKFKTEKRSGIVQIKMPPSSRPIRESALPSGLHRLSRPKTYFPTPVRDPSIIL